MTIGLSAEGGGSTQWVVGARRDLPGVGGPRRAVVGASCRCLQSEAGDLGTPHVDPLANEEIVERGMIWLPKCCCKMLNQIGAKQK